MKKQYNCFPKKCRNKTSFPAFLIISRFPKISQILFFLLGITVLDHRQRSAGPVVHYIHTVSALIPNHRSNRNVVSIVHRAQFPQADYPSTCSPFPFPSAGGTGSAESSWTTPPVFSNFLKSSCAFSMSRSCSSTRALTRP